MNCEWIPILRDIIVAGSAVFAAYIAFKGLNVWKQELKGGSEYQIAKDTLRAVYKVWDAFVYVRHPAVLSHEYPEGMKDKWGRLKGDCSSKGLKYVYETRCKFMEEAFSELEDRNSEALVEWGFDKGKYIVALRQCRSKLLITIERHLARNGELHATGFGDREADKGIKLVLYDLGEHSEDNNFTQELNAAIKPFEDWLRPHISKT